MTEWPAGQAMTRFSYLYDPGSSISLLIDEIGIVKESYGYSAYGAANNSLTKKASGFSTGPTPTNPIRFQGKRFDSGSGSYDMGARRYSPGTGRWLQQDFYYDALDNLGLSQDPLTSNRYAFLGANPVNYVEWDGHTFTVSGGGGAPLVVEPPEIVPNPEVVKARNRFERAKRKYIRALNAVKKDIKTYKLGLLFAKEFKTRRASMYGYYLSKGSAAQRSQAGRRLRGTGRIARDLRKLARFSSAAGVSYLVLKDVQKGRSISMAVARGATNTAGGAIGAFLFRWGFHSICTAATRGVGSVACAAGAAVAAVGGGYAGDKLFETLTSD